MINSCLITGAKGFLGRYVNDFLIENGYFIETIGRGSGNSIHCDLSLQIPHLSNSPELVIHCAGKAHMVPKTEAENKAFFDVNVQGTKNLLSGLEQMPDLPKSFVFISTVSVYGKDEGENMNEETPLLATEPYGVSKIEAEKLILRWCDDKKVTCTILRLPLLVGSNPPGNLGAMIKGIMGGYYFNIGGGKAKKSMVLAEDVAKIIPKAAQIGGVYNLTDSYHPSFNELSALIAKQAHKKQPQNMPYLLAKTLSVFGDVLGKRFPLNSRKLEKIVKTLTFDDTKAKHKLAWKPVPVLSKFII